MLSSVCRGRGFWLIQTCIKAMKLANSTVWKGRFFFFLFPSWSCVWNVCCAKEATPLLLTNQITWLAIMLENTVWFSLFSASLNRMLSSQSLPFFPNADRALYFLYLSLTRSGVLQATFLPCPYHSILHPSYQYGETVLILFTIHTTFQWWK